MGHSYKYCRFLQFYTVYEMCPYVYPYPYKVIFNKLTCKKDYSKKLLRNRAMRFLKTENHLRNRGMDFQSSHRCTRSPVGLHVTGTAKIGETSTAIY